MPSRYSRQFRNYKQSRNNKQPRHSKLLLTLLLCVGATACGQKGPLYLPGQGQGAADQTQNTIQAAKPSATAQQDADKEEKKEKKPPKASTMQP